MDTRTLSGLAVAIILLNGCGGGGDDDSPGPGPQADPGSIATVDGVMAHYAALALYIPRTQENGEVASFAKGQSRLSRSKVAAAAVEPCEASGTYEVIEEGPQNVDSPFTSSPISVLDAMYDECVQTTGDRTYTLNGRWAYGALATDAGFILYDVAGDLDTGEPLHQINERPMDGGTLAEEYTFLGRWDGKFVYADSQPNYESYDYRMSVDMTISASLDGVALGSGSYRLGTADKAFRIHTYDGETTTTLGGELEFETDTCAPGPLRVKTTDPIEFDRDAGHFIAGEIELRSQEGTATATFNSDGSVTFQDLEGTTRTVDPQDLPQQVWESDCFAG